MSQMKTPGVYIVEKDAFPDSVVQVPTAVPAFVGYTQKAMNGSKTLLNKPMRISSLSEYIKYFGEGPGTEFTLKEVTGADGDPVAIFSQAETSYGLELAGTQYRMWDSMRFFYANGGGPCFVVSVGSFTDAIEPTKLSGTGDDAGKGLATLVKETEPTMVVIPDLMSLTGDSAESDCIAVQQAMLSHCGDVMRSRIAILDVFGGYKDRQDEDGDVIASFRNDLGINFLDYACAYYPWVETSIVQASELSVGSLDTASRTLLQTILTVELSLDGVAEDDPKLGKVVNNVANITATDLKPDEAAHMEKSLIALSPIYNEVLGDIRNQLNLMPPSSAMAGVLTMVDDNRGVWKAPANVSLNSVIKPAVNISHDDQEDLNVTPMGKSINAIRSFIGEGTLVWGARTLDGNSQDWKYINVRRTMIMLEQSVKNAAKAYVFEPNDANTWITVKGMIDNFLYGLWTQGALVGPKPEQAYQTTVGLGATMTGNDILDGIMRVSVLVAISRPAEFIEITFQQKMQEA